MLKKISSFINRFIITGLLLSLFSCNNMPAGADADKKNQEGIDYMNAGNYKMALVVFIEALKDPMLSQNSKGTIFRNIALTYNELDKPDSSIHYSTIAAKCYKKNSYHYLVNMADVDLLTGKTAKAISVLLSAAKLNADALSVNNTLGLIYLGEYEDAYINLEKALVYNKKAFEINGDRVTEEVLGRNYYKLDDFENAEYHYQHLLEKYPDMINYSMYAGMIKYKLKKIKDAERYFDDVILKDSSYKETIENFKENNR